MSADATAQLLLLIQSNADLTALQATGRELGLAQAAAAAAGQSTMEYDLALQNLNREMGSKAVGLYLEKLTAGAAAEAKAGELAGVNTAALTRLNEARAQVAQRAAEQAAAEQAAAEAALRDAAAANEAAQANARQAAELEAAEQGVIDYLTAQALFTQAQQRATAATEEQTVANRLLDETHGNLISRERLADAGLRELYDTQFAYTAFINGQYLFALTEAARVTRGLTISVKEFPFLLPAAELAGVGTAIYEAFKSLNEESAKQMKQIAENAEQMAKRIAAANEHTGFGEVATAMIKSFDDIAAAADRTVKAVDAVTTAKNKLLDGQTQLKLAQIDLAEAQETARAEADGATPEQLTGIKLKYADQRVAATAEGDLAAGRREVDDKQKALTDAQSAVTAAEGEASTVKNKIAEDQARAQAQAKKAEADYQTVVSDAAKKKAEIEARETAAAAAGDENAYASFGPYEIEKQQQDDRVTAAQKQRDQVNTTNAAKQAPISGKDADDLKEFQESLNLAKIALVGFQADLDTANTKLQMIDIKNGVAGTKQGAEDAAAARALNARLQAAEQKPAAPALSDTDQLSLLERALKLIESVHTNSASANAAARAQIVTVVQKISELERKINTNAANQRTQLGTG